MQISRKSESAGSIFLYLALLTACFLLLEFSYLIQCNSAYFEDYQDITAQLVIPRSILPEIILFVCIQLAIHLIYLVTVFAGCYFCSSLLGLSGEQRFKLALCTWFAGIGAVLTANQYYFPNSSYSYLFAFILPDGSANLYLAMAFAIIFFTVVMFGCIDLIIRLAKKSWRYVFILMLACSVLFWLTVSKSTSVYHVTASSDKPNVFIIGIDSLRPDHLSYFGSDLATPFFDNFLNQSTVFSEAVTPLARTFPSWATILTGEYPRQSGIRTNLMNVDQINLSQTLPAVFRQHGYETVYATDETRFSNIDHTFGFNEIIAPPVGLNDFILGTLNDFPFSNLLVNTELGYWLFPHSYANRPVGVTYDPDTFLKFIAKKMPPASRQPLFMAVHFCLPHFPYKFDRSNARALTPQMNYRESIQRVDQQVRDFIAYLRQQHLLDHAVVVLLSDHGEALELYGDRITESDHYLGKRNPQGKVPRFYPPSLDEEGVNQSGGHGTDVLGLPQYHTLLAYQLFGMGTQRRGEVSGVVPLNQIKASLLALAGISKTGEPNDIAAIVRGRQQQIPLQHVFLESDFSPAAIRSVYPDVRKAMVDGLKIFEVDPVTTRLTVKPDMHEMINRSKQYADIYGDWMLALYPQPGGGFKSILINLQTGQWSDEMQSDFVRRSPEALMMAKLKRFFSV